MYISSIPLSDNSSLSKYELFPINASNSLDSSIFFKVISLLSLWALNAWSRSLAFIAVRTKSLTAARCSDAVSLGIMTSPKS